MCDIFTQINSKGRQLDVFDLINALLKPRGLQLKHLWRAAAPDLAFVETDRMNRYVLQVMSILKQAYCSPKYLYFLIPGVDKAVREPDGSLRKEKLVASTEEFEKLWHEAVQAMRRAIDLLKHPQEYGAISSAYLPYVSILPPSRQFRLQLGRVSHTPDWTPSARSGSGTGRACLRSLFRLGRIDDRSGLP